MMYMLKTYLYLPEELDRQIKNVAKNQKKSKAEVIRSAVENGLKSINQDNSAGLKAFAKLAEIGIKHNVKGPKDSAKRHDYYLWAKDWNK